jgi:hypothetical protein
LKDIGGIGRTRRPVLLKSTSWRIMEPWLVGMAHSTKESIFSREIARWYPKGTTTWLLERDQSPGHVQLRRNRDEALRFARALIDAKKEELKAGTSRRDVMSLLGSPSSA